MAVQTVATTDGGRVDYWVEPDAGSTFRGVIHVQKYDGAGQKLGAEFTTQVNTTEKYQVYALSNGGYVVGATNNTMDGLTLVGGVFGADGTQIRSLFGGSQWDLEVSPDGGFMVGSITTVHHGFTVPDSRLQLYDNAGNVVRTGTISAQAGPQITVDGEGVFHASWTDRGGNPHTLTVDPQNPRLMESPPAPGGVGWIDDVGASQGVSMGGGGTDDSTPTIRITVSEVGWVAYELAYSPAFASNAPSNPSRFVEVTAADVARGYVELPISSPIADGNYKLAARFENADGFVSAEKWVPIRIDTHTETQPTVTKAVDNEGAQQGDLASGATTDDTTPTIHISLAGTGAQPFDKVLVFDNGQQINFFQLDSTNAGGFSFTQSLAAGSHSITAFIQDMAGNRSPISAAFNLTVAQADRQPQITETEGGAIFRGFSEKHLAGGTDPNGLLTRASGGFGLVAEDGIDDLTIGGVKVITDGVFTATTITTSFGSTLEIFSYDASTQRIGWRYQINRAQDHSAEPGPEPRTVRDVIPIELTDRDGDVAHATFRMSITDDKPLLSADTDTAAAGGGAATGNVLTDAAAGDADDSDAGADRLGADGGRMYMADVASQTVVGQRFEGGPLVIQGAHGTLTIASNGDYSYVARADAPAAATDAFRYWVADNDGGRASSQTLTFTITDSGGSSSGQVLRSDQYGDTIQGGAGADTLIAGQGPDQLTGGGGADAFVYQNTPWNAGVVTDFAVGTDRLDLSALFQASGYSGPNPQGDGYIRLQAEGGGTAVYYDTDGPASGNTIWFKITTLQGVTGATWTQLSGDSAPPPPPPSTIQFDNTGAELREGDGAPTTFTFFVDRTGSTSGTSTVNWSVSGFGSRPAGPEDFQGGAFPGGTLTFAAGETRKAVSIDLVGDDLPETDEQFIVTLSGASGASLGSKTQAVGTMFDDDTSSPPPPSSGQVINSPGPGSTLTGGAGADTLNASRGPDVLTGGGAGDVFAWADVPWSAARVTDFVVGTDQLDLRGALADVGYTGSDPVADGYVRLVNGSNGTAVYLDSDGRGAADQWGTHIVTLDGVYGGGDHLGTSNFTWAQLSGGWSEPPPPPPPPSGDGQVFTSDQYGDTLQGGAGNDTLNAGQGPDQMTGGGGADHFVFAALPWNAGRITDFAPGADKLDLSALFDAAPAGSVEFRSDGQGNTQVYFDRDDPNGGDWPFLVTTLTGVSPGQIGAGDWIV